MKQFFTKQFTMLAIMFFASIGSAFGYTITFDYNGANATDENVQVYFESPDGDYWLSHEEPISVNEGATIRFRAEGRGVYLVQQVLVDGEDVTAQHDPSTGYEIANVSADHVVKIVCQKMPSNTITLTLSHADVSYMRLSGEFTTSYWKSTYDSRMFEVPAGGNLWLSYQCVNTAYPIHSVQVDGVDVTAQFISDGGYRFSSISDDHEVNVVFDQLESHRITVNWVDHLSNVLFRDVETGVEMWGEDQELAAGKTVRMFLNTETGYRVKRVTVIDSNENPIIVTEAYKANGYYEFESLSDDYEVDVVLEEAPTHSVTVNFETEKTGWIYFLNYSGDPNSGFTTNPESGVPYSFTEGTNVRLVLGTSDEKYEIGSIVIDGATDVTSDFLTNDYCEITDLTADHTVTVTYKERPKLTFSYDLSGGIYLINWSSYLPGEYDFASGTNIQLEAVPNEGYKVATVVVDGEDVTEEYQANGYYEFVVTGDCEVAATFEKLPALTVNYDGSLGSVVISDYGSIASGYPFTYEEGTDVTLEVIPQVGYKVVSISVDGTPISMEDFKANGNYKFTITDDCVFNVNIVQAVYYNVNVTYNDQQVEVGIGNNYSLIWNPYESAPFMEGSEINLYISPTVSGLVPTATVNGNDVTLTYEPGYNRYSCVITDNLDQNLDVDVESSFAGVTRVHASFNGSQTDMSLNYSTIYPDNVMPITKGLTVQVQLTPRIGYEVASVFLDNKQLTADSEGVYEFTVPEYDDCYLNVTMQKKTAPATVPFSLSDLGVATFCSEYDLDFSNMSSIKAYVASGYNPNTQEIILTRVKEVPAGTGLLIKGAAGDYNIPTTTTSYMYANMLRGIGEPEFLSRTCWYNLWAGGMEYANCLLGEDGNFHPINEGETKTLPAYQAYLIIPCSAVNEGSLAKITTIFLDDDEAGGIATGIGFLWADKSGGKTNAKADDVFNLQGQKVNSKTLKPGIYIRNGKKFMVK